MISITILSIIAQTFFLEGEGGAGGEGREGEGRGRGCYVMLICYIMLSERRSVMFFYSLDEFYACLLLLFACGGFSALTLKVYTAYIRL